MKNIVYILTLFSVVISFAQHDDNFNKGNSLYNDGEYQ
jgi:hypothetical protein